MKKYSFARNGDFLAQQVQSSVPKSKPVLKGKRESVLDITSQLASFAANLSFGDLPREVTERAKRLILDLTGIMIRARYDAESTPSLIAAVERLGLTSGKCSVLGDVRTYAPTAAALIQ